MSYTRNCARPQIAVSDLLHGHGASRLAAALAAAIPHADVHVRPIRVAYTAPTRMVRQIERVYASLGMAVPK